MGTLLKIEYLQKYYGRKNNITKAIDDISFQVSEGEFLSIMGASGSGKTTLLNCIATIDTISAGHIYLKEKDITLLKEKQLAEFRRENLGFIFQDYNLLDVLTIQENIALSLIVGKKAEKGKINQKVAAAAEQLGIGQILGKFPYEISGGQKQRCACARAMVHDPGLILADEPTGALDSKSAANLLETLSQMNEVLHATILMVTHDAYSASCSKRILFLKDGRIFNEIYRGNKSRKEFFHEILDVMSLLGGGAGSVH